jgi:beta-N-acetylhexosaminidase
MVGFRGLDIGPADPITKALAAGLGGVILFDRDQLTGGQRNIASPKQLAKLTAALRAAAPGPLLIGIDQEGGTVPVRPARRWAPRCRRPASTSTWLPSST